jgi:hypothetical protein
VLDPVAAMAGLTFSPFVEVSGATLVPLMPTATTRAQLDDTHFTNTSRLRCGVSYRI